jgi:hypothetical protein
MGVFVSVEKPRDGINAALIPKKSAPERIVPKRLTLKE